MAVPEEVIKQTAATGEQSQHTLASPEFFFLLQRIDRLDEKLTAEIKGLSGEIKALDAKLTAEIRDVDGRLTAEIKGLEDKVSRSLENLRFWAIGAVIAIAVGFIGTIVTLVLR